MAVIIPTGWEDFGRDVGGASSSILAGLKLKADREAALAPDPTGLLMLGMAQRLAGEQAVTDGQSNGQPLGQPVVNGGDAFEASRAGVPNAKYSTLEGTIMGKALGQTPESKAEMNIAESLAKDIGKQKQKVESSKLTSNYNLNLVAENMYDLSNLLSMAYGEGGAGNKFKAMKAKLAREGWLPEEMASKFAESSAVYGKRVEIISKMFPMLTQQIGKEGSVRLIESVFNKIGKTIPNLEQAPAVAKTQMRETVLSMYRINRALENVNVDDFDLTNEEGKANFADRVQSEVGKIKIEGEEKDQLDSMIGTILEPLDKHVTGNKKQASGELSSGLKYTLE